MRGRLLALSMALLAGLSAPASAADRFALIVIGASGDPKYAETYSGWHTMLVSALRERMRYDADKIVSLTERGGEGTEVASATNVRRAVATLAGRLKPEDLLLVVLIGHGTFDGETAKFNVVGPDLDAGQWSELLKSVPGRLVIVNTTGASFPFLAELAGRDRIVLTATDSAAQRFETTFPEHFIRALSTDESDVDKNGRVSLWEAFSYASLGVRQWYEQRGQLATERALLDDDGDGTGKEAGAPGPDGALARATYLDPDVPAAAEGDESLAELYRRRAELELQIEALKGRKDTMPADEYLAQLEKLGVELARVSREIRSRS